VRDILQVDIEQDMNTPFTLLFDPDYNLEERILMEQFLP
jgi:NAD+ kinase